MSDIHRSANPVQAGAISLEAEITRRMEALPGVAVKSAPRPRGDAFVAASCGPRGGVVRSELHGIREEAAKRYPRSALAERRKPVEIDLDQLGALFDRIGRAVA